MDERGTQGFYQEKPSGEQSRTIAIILSDLIDGVIELIVRLLIKNIEIGGLPFQKEGLAAWQTNSTTNGGRMTY